MRTLLAILATTVITATAAVATFAVSGGFTTTHTAVTVDPTVGPAVLLTSADAMADGWAVDCSHWGQVYGQVTISGARTIQARGCVNPSGLGRGDSFGNGTLARLRASVER